MAVADTEWQTTTSHQISSESYDHFHPDDKSSVTGSEKSETHGRAMQPGLKFQDHRSLLQGDDVEVFFKTLEENTEITEPQSLNSEEEVNQEVPENTNINNISCSTKEEEIMFQNSMHTVPPMPGSTPTYDTTGVAGTGAMTSGVNPVYVPTTRPVLPPMHYMTNGASQGVSSPSSMWPMNTADPSYSAAAANPHSSVSPRFAFAPSPGSPISTPAARTDSSFTSPLARPSGINPYSYMGTPEISSAWNFQMALQQGYRQTGPGKSSLFSLTLHLCML